MNSSNNKSKRETNRRTGAMLNRIADRVDLAIDVLTLGQYGLEQEHATAACEGNGQMHRSLARENRSRRRGDCDPSPAISWDWPHSSRDAVSGW